MILNKEKGKRMWGGDGGSGGSGGSSFDPSTLAGFAQQSWVNDNFVSKAFFNQMFELQYSQRVLTKDGETVIDDETTDMVATPNTFIDTTTQTRTDEETGYTIETTNTITGIKAKVGLWTPSYLSALGQNTSGGGGGGSLNEPLLSINNSGLAAPTDAEDGMTVVWDKTTHKWKYGATGGGGGSVSWSNITNKPTTINGFGITDAKIVNGTITLGNQSITPLTSSDISDMATKTWVGNQNYLTQTAADSRYISISFFARLFQAKNGSANVNPNDTTSTIDSIKALFGFWTDQYISALGQNSGGGGGGVLLEPLLSINNSGLAAPTDAEDGMTVVWDKTTHKWKYGATGGGGGSVSWSNITNKPTTISGFGITDAKIVNGTITLGNQSITPLTSSDISDMATKTWVGNQNYLTQNAADSRYISISFFARLFQAKNGSANVNPNDTTSTIDSIKAMFGFWTDQYISALGQNSGGGGGGVSLNEPLSSINTSGLSAPGSSQDGMTIVWDNAASKWKYGAAGGGSYTLPLAANGTRGGIQIGFTTDGANRNYAVLLSNEKAYVNVPWTDTDTWRPVQDNLTSTSTSDCLSANQGKVLKGYIDTLNGYFTDGSAKTAMKLTTARTIWGQTFDGSENVTGSLNSVESITMSGWIHGTQCIEMNDDDSSNLKKYGGFIDFHFRDKFGNKMSYDDDYSARLIEGDNGELDGVIRCCTKNPDTKYSFFAEVGLRIGNARLVWDSDSNALKVEKYDGTAANFYATGGVSALGVPTSGSGTVDTLNVNTLKAVNNLYIGENANSIYYDYDDDTLFIQSGSGDIALKGSLTMRGINATQRSINTQGGNLSLGGGYIYLTSGVYLYTDGSNIKVNIGGQTYTLNKS